MNLAETIVARLLNEEHFDVRQRPDLYEPKGTKDPKGRDVFRVCSRCEAEYGADKQYIKDETISMSHGQCRFHVIQQYVQDLGFTQEQAEVKVSHDAPPNWREILGEPAGLESPSPEQQGYGTVWNPHKEAAPPPKATFWATSGSGGV
jgi:hypothetical protein